MWHWQLTAKNKKKLFKKKDAKQKELDQVLGSVVVHGHKAFTSRNHL
jgi:hypothetical protein